MPFYENGILNSPYNNEIIFIVSLLNLRNLGSWPHPFLVLCPSLDGKKESRQTAPPDPWWGQEAPSQSLHAEHGTDPGSLLRMHRAPAPFDVHT